MNLYLICELAFRGWRVSHGREPRIIIAYAEGSAPAIKEVMIFEHAHYGGKFQSLKKGRYDGVTTPLRIGNKSLTSVLVPSGIVVRLYEHANFQGESFEIMEDVPDMFYLRAEWNDRTSSIIVYDEGELT